MMKIVQFVNLSSWTISLRDDTGSCFLSELKPGKSKNKTTCKIAKRTFDCGTSGWRVGVLKDGKFANIWLYGDDIISKSPRIIFKTEEIEKDEKKMKMLCVEGIESREHVDGPLRLKLFGNMIMNSRVWNKRPTFLIAQEVEGRYKSEPPLPPKSSLSSGLTSYKASRATTVGSNYSSSWNNILKPGR